MSDETNPTEDGKTAPPAPTPAEAQKPDSGKGEHMIPKTRFDEVNEQYKAVQKQLDTLANKESDREEAEAIARGDHEKVIADLKPKAEQAELYVSEIEGLLETAMERIPEDKRHLIPEELSPLARFKLLQQWEAAGVFATPKAPATDAGAQGDGSQKKPVELTALERDTAKKFSMTEERYAAFKEVGTVGEIPEKIIKPEE